MNKLKGQLGVMRSAGIALWVAACIALSSGIGLCAEAKTVEEVVEREMGRLEGALEGNDVELVQRWLGAEVSGVNEAAKSGKLERRMRIESSSIYSAPGPPVGMMKMAQDALGIYGPGADAVMVLTAGNLAAIAPNVNAFNTACGNVAYYLAVAQLFANVVEGKKDPAPAITVCVMVAQRMLSKIGTSGANVAASVIGLAQWTLESVAVNLKAEAELRWWNDYMQHYEQYSIHDWAKLAQEQGAPGMKKRLQEFWDLPEVTAKDYFWTLTTFNPNYRNDFAAFYLKKTLAEPLQGFFNRKQAQQREQVVAQLKQMVQRVAAQQLRIECRILPVTSAGAPLDVKLDGVFISARVADRDAADRYVNSDKPVAADLRSKELWRVPVQGNKIRMEMGLLQFLKETRPHPLARDDGLVLLEAEAEIGGEQIELELIPHEMCTRKGRMDNGVLLWMGSEGGRTWIEPQYSLRLIMPTRPVKVEVTDHEGKKTTTVKRVPIAGHVWIEAGPVGTAVDTGKWPLKGVPTVRLNLPAPDTAPPLPAKPSPDYGALRSDASSAVGEYASGKQTSEEASRAFAQAGAKAELFDGLLGASFGTYKQAYMRRAALMQPSPSDAEIRKHCAAMERTWMAPVEAWERDSQNLKDRLDSVHDSWQRRLDAASDRVTGLVADHGGLPAKLQGLRSAVERAGKAAAGAMKLRQARDLDAIAWERKQLALRRENLITAMQAATQASNSAPAAIAVLEDSAEKLHAVATPHLGSGFTTASMAWRNIQQATVLAAKIDLRYLAAKVSLDTKEPDDALAKVAQADARMAGIEAQAALVNAEVAKLAAIIADAPPANPEMDRVAKSFKELQDLTREIRRRAGRTVLINGEKREVFDLNCYDMCLGFLEKAEKLKAEAVLDEAEDLVSDRGWCTVSKAQKDRMWGACQTLGTLGCGIGAINSAVENVWPKDRELPNCSLAQHLAGVRGWVQGEDETLQDLRARSPMSARGLDWQGAWQKNQDAIAILEAVWPDAKPHSENRTAPGAGLTKRIGDALQQARGLLDYRRHLPYVESVNWHSMTMLRRLQYLESALGILHAQGLEGQWATIRVRVAFEGDKAPERHNVSLQGQYQRSGMDDDGVTWYKVVPGEYTLVAIAAGFSEAKETFTVGGEEKREITLTLKAGARLPKTEAKPPIVAYDLTRVTRKTLVRQPGMYGDVVPKWTPDGKAVVINTNTGLKLIEIASGKMTDVATQPASSPATRISTDIALGRRAGSVFIIGDTIIVQVNIKHYRLASRCHWAAYYYVPLSGGKPEFLFEMPWEWRVLDIRLEDGQAQTYFYKSTQDATEGLYVAGDKPEEARRIATSPLLLSPDGTMGLYNPLAYRLHLDNPSKECKVFSFPDGKMLRKIPDSDQVIYASWSPDSKYIVAFRHGPKDPNIAVYDARGEGKPIIIETEALTYGPPSWSPDGKHIVCWAGLGRGREDCLLLTVGR